MSGILFVGLDVHKIKIAVAIAADGRDGEVRSYGSIPNTVTSLRSLSEKLSQNGTRELHFCYEAGPCGFQADRALTEIGHFCTVVAPSLIPVRSGDRVKTDRRDAVMLAKLHRAGELTSVWVPDACHEAIRDLVRARATAVQVRGKARQHLQGLLLRRGWTYPGKKGWTKSYRRWLSTVRLDHPAAQVVFQDYVDAVSDADARVERLTKQIEMHVQEWSLGPVVEALQTLRGVGFIVAVTVTAEVGDFTRFENPRQLMAYLGLVPSEYSSGSKVRRGGITKAGSSLARHALVEGAWSYRLQPRVSRELQVRLETQPKVVRDIAWKGQLRLCNRFRKLIAAGKPRVVVTTAIAREMIGFIWAIACETQGELANPTRDLRT